MSVPFTLVVSALLLVENDYHNGNIHHNYY